MPSIQSFKEWPQERCKDAQRTYRDEQLDPIVDMFVSAFAKRLKMDMTARLSSMTISLTATQRRQPTESSDSLGPTKSDRCSKVQPQNCFVKSPELSLSMAAKT